MMRKYNEIFMDCFSIPEMRLNNDLLYQSIPAWDSVGHMKLITLMEEAFDIMFDTCDIIDFSSYEKGKEVLSKYDVVL